VVTTATDANNFAAASLAGFGDDAFLFYRIYVFRDAGGAGAAPQDSWTNCTNYVSATGAFTHAAMGANLAVGDTVLIVHQQIYNILLLTDRLTAARAGYLDFLATTEAAGPFSYLDAGGEQDVYENTGVTRRKISFDMDLSNMTLDGTIRVYRKVDGANYRLHVTQAFTVADGVDAWSVTEAWTNQHWKVTYQESADEGAARSVPYNVIIQPLE